MWRKCRTEYSGELAGRQLVSLPRAQTWALGNAQDGYLLDLSFSALSLQDKMLAFLFLFWWQYMSELAGFKINPRLKVVVSHLGKLN